MAGLLPAVANARKMNQKWSTKLEFTMVPHWCVVRHMCWKVLNHTETGEQVLLDFFVASDVAWVTCSYLLTSSCIAKMKLSLAGAVFLWTA